MEPLFFVGFAIAAAFLSALIRRMEPTIAALISLGACVMLLLGVGNLLGEITQSLGTLTQSVGLDEAYISVLLRVVGIAYLAQIGAQTCRDAGSANIAEHVELCARVVILAICAPLFLELLDMLAEVLR